MTAHADGRIDATTTVEVIQEFAHIRAQRRSRPDAARVARHYMAAFSLLVTTPDDLERGLAFFELYPALGAFDAVLAGVALERRAEALVSADRAFASVVGLPLVDPATRAINRLRRD